MAFLEVHEVTLRFGSSGNSASSVTALQPVSLSLERGTFVGIAGPSGSGKSSLLAIMSAIQRPSSGTVVIAGRAIDFAQERELERFRREHVGFVFQYFNLLPTMTALENVALMPLLHGQKEREAFARARAMLEAVGVLHRENHLPQELSGGEMQRVAIARATVMEPPLLVADEPTGNLDSAHGREVVSLLRGRADEGALVVMASHSQEALQQCDTVIRLRDGRVEYGG